MKKTVAILLSLIMLCAFLVVPANAATNDCSKFQSAINMLRWRIDGNEVSKGENFPASVVLDYTLSKFDEKTYGIEPNEEGFFTKIKIPATVFEAKAKELFAKFSLDELRSVEVYDGFDETTNKVLYRKCYNEAQQAYIFGGGGGMGDSTTYRVYGYMGVGMTVVYSAFVDLAEELDAAPAGKTEGKDYIRYDGKFYEVIHWLETIVENNTEVRFVSWKKVSTITSLELVRNEATLEKKEPTSSVVSGNTSSNKTSSAVSENSSSNKTSSAVKDNSSSDKTSSVVSENTSSDKTSSVVSENTSSTEASSATSSESTDVVYETVAETKEVTVQAAEKAFPEGTVVAVVPVTEGKVYETATTAMKEKATKFVAFDITATKENVTVQPDGTVKAEFDVPEDYDLDKVCVLYVDDNGNTEKMPTTVDKKTGKAVATLSHFSVYVVAEMIENPAETPASFPWGILVAGVALVLCGGAAGWYFLVYKKKAVK